MQIDDIDLESDTFPMPSNTTTKNRSGKKVVNSIEVVKCGQIISSESVARIGNVTGDGVLSYE